VWPEYNGHSKDEFDEAPDEGDLDEDTDEQWGKIVAGALTRFVESYDLEIMAFEHKTPRLWQRLVSPHVDQAWRQTSALTLSIEYVNSRQHEGHESPVFLLAPTRTAASAPQEIRSPMVDRSNLLPFGIAILDLGIEEAVLEITFAEHENQFLQTLNRVAGEFDHQTKRTESHFVSHWAIANKATLGADWDKF